MVEQTEVDYVVEQVANNAMIIKKRYVNNRELMLKENPGVNKENFIAIESDVFFSRYNEVTGKQMKWIQ